MRETYIIILNSINGDSRTSFSQTITEYMPVNIDAREKETLEKGYTITPEKTEDNQIFSYIFKTLKEKGYWSPWMDKWTSATIYLLYQGEVQSNM